MSSTHETQNGTPYACLTASERPSGNMKLAIKRSGQKRRIFDSWRSEKFINDLFSSSRCKRDFLPSKFDLLARFFPPSAFPLDPRHLRLNPPWNATWRSFSNVQAFKSPQNSNVLAICLLKKYHTFKIANKDCTVLRIVATITIMIIHGTPWKSIELTKLRVYQASPVSSSFSLSLGCLICVRGETSIRTIQPLQLGVLGLNATIFASVYCYPLRSILWVISIQHMFRCNAIWDK